MALLDAREKSEQGNKKCIDSRLAAILEAVPDPEIPVLSVMDLGIVRRAELAPANIVEITPTYTGCPATFAIEQSIRAALDLAGHQNIRIKTVLSPPWTTDWMSASAREKLRAYGISPPTRGAPLCPQCGSANCVVVSAFGSTPCKALWRCGACLEPFELFKCH